MFIDRLCIENVLTTGTAKAEPTTKRFNIARRSIGAQPRDSSCPSGSSLITVSPGQQIRSRKVPHSCEGWRRVPRSVTSPLYTANQKELDERAFKTWPSRGTFQTQRRSRRSEH